MRLSRFLRHIVLGAASAAGVGLLFAKPAGAQSKDSSLSLSVSVNGRQDSNGHGRAWAGLIFLDRGNESVPYIVAGSVEPGSPAQLGGLLAGDSILSFNDVSIHTVLEHPARFKPGEKVIVKLRRNGLQSYSLTLGSRPSHWLMRERVKSASLRVHDLLASNDILQPFGGSAVGSLPLVGAELIAVNSDLSDVLGVKEGVLVLKVASGSPAAEAGLRSGDVLLRAGDTDLEQPATLSKVMQRASKHTTTLTVQRAGKTRQVTLHW